MDAEQWLTPLQVAKMMGSDQGKVPTSVAPALLRPVGRNAQATVAHAVMNAAGPKVPAAVAPGLMRPAGQNAHRTGAAALMSPSGQNTHRTGAAALMSPAGQKAPPAHGGPSTQVRLTGAWYGGRVGS